MAGVLDVPLPEHDERVAAVPQPAGVGRVRGFDLLHHLAAVLVPGADSRPGDAARPGGEPLLADDLRFHGHGMAGLGAALEALSHGLPDAGGAGHAAGAL